MRGQASGLPVGFPVRQEIIETDEKRNDLESYILTMRDPFLTASIVSFVFILCQVPNRRLSMMFFFSTTHLALRVMWCRYKDEFFALRNTCSTYQALCQKMLRGSGSRTSAVKEVSMVHSLALEMLGGDMGFPLR